MRVLTNRKSGWKRSIVPSDPSRRRSTGWRFRSLASLPAPENENILCSRSKASLIVRRDAGEQSRYWPPSSTDGYHKLLDTRKAGHRIGLQTRCAWIGPWRTSRVLLGDDTDTVRPDAWCSECEKALVAFKGASSEDWFNEAEFKILCAGLLGRGESGVRLIPRQPA